MSPELLKAYLFSDKGMVEFNKEKADIYSIGVTFLRLCLTLKEKEIEGLNSDDSDNSDNDDDDASTRIARMTVRVVVIVIKYR